MLRRRLAQFGQPCRWMSSDVDTASAALRAHIKKLNEQRAELKAVKAQRLRVTRRDKQLLDKAAALKGINSSELAEEEGPESLSALTQLPKDETDGATTIKAGDVNERLDALKPPRPPKKFLPDYPTQLAKLTRRVNRSFLKIELGKVVDNASRLTKEEIIEKILDGWGWPTEAQVAAEKQAHEDSKARLKDTTCVFLLSPDQYFFVRDGQVHHQGLKIIQASRVDPINLGKLDPQTPVHKFSEGPAAMYLVARAPQHAMEEFTAALKTRLDSLHTVEYPLEEFGGAANKVLWPKIIQLTDAWIENVGEDDSKVRLVYSSETGRDLARRLMTVARNELDPEHTVGLDVWTQASVSNEQPVSHSSSEDQAETSNENLTEPLSEHQSQESVDPLTALYPFNPPTATIASVTGRPNTGSPLTHPASDWYLDGRSWFRLRTVGGWFNESDAAGPSTATPTSNLIKIGDISLDKSWWNEPKALFTLE